MTRAEDHCLYFLSGRFQRALNQLAEEAFLPAGFAPSYGYILLALQHGPRTQKQLGETLHFQPSTLSRFIDKLMSCRYVTKTCEGKFVVIALTTLGEEKLSLVYDCLQTLARRYSELLGPDVAQQLSHQLLTSCQALED